MGKIEGLGEEDGRLGSAERLVWFERAVAPELLALVGDDITMLGPGTPTDFYAGVERAQGVVASAGYYGRDVLDRCSDLKVIARTGIGYDRVDLKAATARGVAVCNTPDAPTVSTAEHAVALLLTAAKSLNTSSAELRAGGRYAYEDHRAVELAGKTLGLVGFGRVARRVAAVAVALEMKVIAYDPYAPDEAFTVERAETLSELLELSDALSVHVPLTEETAGMFDGPTFARMRRGAIFINAARGGVVDQEALLAAVDDGRIFAAGLDVTDPEPLSPGHRLLHHDRVIVTPHIASSTPEGRKRIFGDALRQVSQVLSGRRPDHIVNPEVWPDISRRVGRTE